MFSTYPNLYALFSLKLVDVYQHRNSQMLKMLKIRNHIILSHKCDISNMFTPLEFQWSWWVMEQNNSKIQGQWLTTRKQCHAETSEQLCAWTHRRYIQTSQEPHNFRAEKKIRAWIGKVDLKSQSWEVANSISPSLMPS